LGRSRPISIADRLSSIRAGITLIGLKVRDKLIVQVVQCRDNVGQENPWFLVCLATRVRLPVELRSVDWPPIAEAGSRIQTALQDWAIAASLPLVILIDEIDSLQNEALLSILRQLRSGFPDRPQGFPQSIGLIGLRDVPDYQIASGGSDHLTTASPFNIKVESLTIRDFSESELVELYSQYSQDTGQSFTPEALALAYRLSLGQPWLVNALARQCVEVVVPDRTVAIEAHHVDEAKENLIRRKDTHLDSLAERLRETRVRAILEPMMAGQNLPESSNEDRDFLVDLGLLRCGIGCVASRFVPETFLASSRYEPSNPSIMSRFRGYK
jgi:hypothetical protein